MWTVSSGRESADRKLQEACAECVASALFATDFIAWASLAKELQGKTTIASVNCEKYNALCKEEGIPGYPTLHL